MPRVVAALLLAALAVGCGGDDEQPAAPAESELAIEVRPEGKAGSVRRDTLRCPGDARCDGLSAEDFAPVAGDVACTEIYGGPATARVTGRLEGAPIDARFSRENGCEIARWDNLGAILGAP